MPHRKYRKRQLSAFAAPGGQRGQRAIPPDGFTEFSLGQCCRIRQSLNGRTMFAPTMSLSGSHGSMLASTPTDLPFQENKTTPLPYRASPLKEETFCLASAELLRQPSAQESTRKPRHKYWKRQPSAFAAPGGQRGQRAIPPRRAQPVAQRKWRRQTRPRIASRR